MDDDVKSQEPSWLQKKVAKADDREVTEMSMTTERNLNRSERRRLIRGSKKRRGGSGLR